MSKAYDRSAIKAGILDAFLAAGKKRGLQLTNSTEKMVSFSLGNIAGIGCLLQEDQNENRALFSFASESTGRLGVSAAYEPSEDRWFEIQQGIDPEPEPEPALTGEGMTTDQLAEDVFELYLGT